MGEANSLAGDHGRRPKGHAGCWSKPIANRPDQWPRIESKRYFRLAVRRSTPLCVKVDTLWARLFGCFLRSYLGRFGASDPASERGEPPRNTLRIVVNHVVDARLRIERSDCRSSCVLDMDEGPNAFAITDDRRFLALHLLGTAPSVQYQVRGP
jgi:hypothetical protein